MKKINNKKGFTIVELVIVIAVIGVLAAILIPTFINLNNRAKVSNTQSFLKNVNTQLATKEANPDVDNYEFDEEGRKTIKVMNDGIKYADDVMGFNIRKISPFDGNEIVWDMENHRFALIKDRDFSSPIYAEAGLKEENAQYLHSNQEDAQADLAAGKAVYLNPEFETDDGSLTIKGPVDCGENTNIKVLNYVSDSSESVDINTNGGTLNINAPSGKVHHYGKADLIDIQKVASASYHENGTVSLVKVANGRVALESESNVGAIHLAATDGEFDDITVAKATNIEMPDFSRDPVEIPAIGKKVVALQEGTADVNADKDYVWLTAVGIYEQVTIGNAEEAGTNYAATSETATQEQKAAAQQIANNITATYNEKEYEVKAVKNGDEWEYQLVSSTEAPITNDVSVEVSIANNVATASVSVGETPAAASTSNSAVVTADNIEEVVAHGASNTFAEIDRKEELIAFRDAWNAGKLSSGTFKLTANIIDISDEPWSPIGNQAHPFTGTFDGNGKTISGLSNNGYSIDINDVFTTDYSKATGAPYGLFGVVGSKDNNKASVTIKNLTLTNVHIENDKFSCVGAVIGGDVSAVKDKNNVTINGSYAGDIQLTNITVSGQKVYGLDGVGGLIGKIYTQGNVEVTGCASSVDVYAVASTNKKVAAVVGYANGGASYNISGNTISGNVYANKPSDGLLDQVANIKKVQLSYVFGVGDNTCTNKLYLLENNEYVEYKMPYVISHERDENGNVTRSVITYINEAEPGVKYIPDNRQDLCDGTLVLNMNDSDSIYTHRFSAYNTLTGSIEFRNCTIGTGMSDLKFTNTTSVLFKDCDIVCGNSIYMIVSGGSLTLDLGTHTCHRTVQICKGGSNVNDQVCPAGTSIYVVSGTFTNTIYNHGQENGVIYIQGGLFTFEESKYGINKISNRGNDAFVITGGTFNKIYGTSETINISNYIPSTHQLNEENDQYVVVAKQ